MPGLPSGTVTLVFTDIEGSTRLLQRTGDAYAGLLELHRRLLRAAFGCHGGIEVSTAGDAFFVAFPSAAEAVAAAADAQRSLADHGWPEDAEVRVRIGIHTGEPQLIGRNYAGLDVHKAARVMAAGHGGQVLISHATRKLLGDDVDVVDLGEHRLKDLLQPEHMYQLRIEGLPVEFPALKTIGTRPTNLPVLPNPTIGREVDVRKIDELLRTGDVRLLTLTGPGGTGKTRLALQAAAELLEAFASGVFFVALSPVRDPDLVVPTIARTLAVRDAPGERLIDTLSEYLQERELLLVLDNFEQVVDAAPALSTLLATTPKVRLLVTSRARLNLSGERVYEVPPLPLPESGDLDALARNDAIALFLARANALKRDFALTEENASAISEICIRLDGLPLAIELAAARIPLLPPEALLRRLDRRLKLLTGGAREADERQRTLRKTIEWSHDLLTAEEQRLFARLAIFIGGWTLEAAENVCGRQDALDLLESLVEKSLLRCRDGVDGEPRFSMLQTVREYALERLQLAGEAADAQRRHVDYFLAVAEEAEADLTGPRQSSWMARLEAEHENFRAAVDAALQHDRVEVIARIGGAVWRFWNARGHLTEGRAWLEAALARRDELAPAVRVKALTAAGVLAQNQEDYGEAIALYEESLALCRELGDGHGIAVALHNLGTTAMYRARYREAKAFLDESLALFREQGNRWRVATGLGNLGSVAWGEGDYDAAEALHREALALRRELGDQRGVVISLYNLTQVSLVQGDDATALARAEQCLAEARDLGDEWGITYALNDIALLALRRCDADAAAGLYSEALLRWQQLGRRKGIADCLEGLAGVARLRGRPGRAARLLGASSALREQIGDSRDELVRLSFEETVKNVRAGLDEASFVSAWASGSELSTAQAIEYASGDESEWMVAEPATSAVGS